jgi:DNA-binding NarL/FixJ family response regulator
LFAQTPPAKPKIKVQIAELSAQGLSPSEIASRLELSIAEVDLALNLLHRV